MNKPNKTGWLVITAVVVASLFIICKIYQDVTSTHAVIARYKFVDVPVATSLVLHDGSFDLTEVDLTEVALTEAVLNEAEITKGIPQTLVIPKRRGVRSLNKILAGPAENVTALDSEYGGLELILPKKFDTVTLVGLIDGKVVATDPVPVGSHWHPPEERVTSGILEVRGIPYLGLRIMAVGVVNKHHDQFFIFQ